MRTIAVLICLSLIACAKNEDPHLKSSHNNTDAAYKARLFETPRDKYIKHCVRFYQDVNKGHKIHASKYTKMCECMHDVRYNAATQVVGQEMAKDTAYLNLLYYMQRDNRSDKHIQNNHEDKQRWGTYKDAYLFELDRVIKTWGLEEVNKMHKGIEKITRKQKNNMGLNIPICHRHVR